MSTKRRSPDRTGHTGWRRGAPSRRTVARNASPTLNWKSNEQPTSARSGSAAANSFHVTIRSPYAERARSAAETSNASLGPLEREVRGQDKFNVAVAAPPGDLAPLTAWQKTRCLRQGDRAGRANPHRLRSRISSYGAAK